MASSSEAMRVLELFELQSEEGPCLDCYRTGQPVLNQVLAPGGEPWSRFSSEAVDAGFKSVEAVPLRLRHTTIGALNLFHTDETGLDQADVAVAQAFADVATIAILQHRAALEGQVLNEQLQHALDSRVSIEQAKGVIAERAGLNMEQAFVALRTHARNQNLRLVDVARGVIEGTVSPAELAKPESRSDL
jgi:GAF domain-containing protein